jgi:hypothetical protein
MSPSPDSATRGPYDLLVDQLLDAVEQRLALLRIELAGLLAEEDAARGRERLDPGGRAANDAADGVDIAILTD